MKALTLHQPWATLVALDVKTIETRSWATKHRGPIAIHAGVSAKALDYFCWEADHCGEVDECLLPLADRVRGEDMPRGRMRAVHNLPLGAVVATANLVDCVPMVHTGEEGAIRTLDIDGSGDLWIVEPQTDEQAEAGEELDQRDVSAQRPYGHFAPGRWAWLLEDIVPLTHPVPTKGRQGLWTWKAQ